MAEPGRDAPGAGGRQRFPRQNRLLKPAEFKRVFAEPCRVTSRYVVILARQNGLGYPRLGLAIARKHIKTAVGRNRVKRQTRETFRKLQGELGSLDVVVLARPGLHTLDRVTLRDYLIRYWRELAERCDES